MKSGHDIKKLREMNSRDLKKCSLWVTGDGVSFPSSIEGKTYAFKHARKNGIAVHFLRKTKRSSGGEKPKKGGKK